MICALIVGHLLFVFTYVQTPFITFKPNKKGTPQGVPFLFPASLTIRTSRLPTANRWWYTIPAELIIYTPYGVIEMRDRGKHLNFLEKYVIIHLKRWYEMKKVNILQLIASICLLVGSIINLLNLLIEIPFALYVCTGPLLLISVILFIIVFVKQIKNKKQNKNDWSAL